MTNNFYLDITLAAIVILQKDKTNIYIQDVINYIANRYNPLQIGDTSINLRNLYLNISAALGDLELIGWLEFGPKDIIIFNSIEAVEITNNISSQEALSYIYSLNVGDNIRLTFTKKDNSVRDITGTIYKPNIGDGYILILDDSKPDGDTGSNIRTVDLRKIISIYIKGVEKTIIG